MRVLRSLLAAAALLAAAPAAAQVTLDSATRAYLEGEWVVAGVPEGNRCADSKDPSKEGWESYEIEFAKSGGTFRITDTVDADWRARIGSARKSGGIVEMTFVHSNGTDFKRVRVTPLGPNRARWAETVGNVPGSPFARGIAYRCNAARRDIASRMTKQALKRLSFSGNAEIFFAAGDAADACEHASDTLQFELAGPVNYSVLRERMAGSSWFGVRKAVSDRDGATLWVHSDAGDAKLRVLWQDPKHILVRPWGETFTRCN